MAASPRETFDPALISGERGRLGLAGGPELGHEYQAAVDLDCARGADRLRRLIRARIAPPATVTPRRL